MSLKELFTPTPKEVKVEEVKMEEKKEERHQDRAEKVSKPGERYTENELMVRLKFFIGCCLAFTLIGIVFTVLYSIMFVTQPLNAISPIDQKFFELIIPVATFLCGTLSGIMLAGTGKEAAMAGAKAAGMNNGNGYGMQQPSFSQSIPVQQPMMQQRPMQSMQSSFQVPQPMQSSFGNQMPMSSMSSMDDDLGLIPGQSPKMHD
jgi:hypothetical protein